MKIELEVAEVQAGYYGNNDPKLIPHDFYWKEWPNTRFCVHGIKLRWACDYCREHFEGGE